MLIIIVIIFSFIQLLFSYLQGSCYRDQVDEAEEEGGTSSQEIVGTYQTSWCISGHRGRQR